MVARGEAPARMRGLSPVSYLEGKPFNIVAEPHGGGFHLLVGLQLHRLVVDLVEFQVELDALPSVVDLPAEDLDLGEVGGVEGMHDHDHLVALGEREAADVEDGGENPVDGVA